ncbi:MAG TPA: cytochrome c oxidase assembly protein [Chloroflexota bacterium]|nr:cytochrome c oxidase assembly protein [Chloroflexota bacterium]
MSAAMQSVLDDWTLPVWLTLATVLTALVYLRGWFALRKTRPRQFTAWRLLSFMAGMASLWAAIGSPLDAFADVLLSAHMVEHLILMSVVPPLVLLGLPVVPLLRGLPKIVRKRVAGPLLRLNPLRRFVQWMARPKVAWLAMNITFLSWHVPAAYDFALEHEGWHDFEHICFLFTSLLFWWCLLRPWPARRRPHDWGILLYLVGADGVNTALSAFLAFCNRPIYPYYVNNPNPFQIAPLPDQILGAVIMWVIGSLAFLIPAAAITFELLQPAHNRTAYTRA